MTASDLAKPLKELQPKHTFFVGIDSDGSVFDTMGIKQRKCLYPGMIAIFDSYLPERPPSRQESIEG